MSHTPEELREAQQFIEKHGVGELPGPRFANGESSDSQRSDLFGGADRANSKTGGSHSKFVRMEVQGPGFSSDWTWEEWMQERGVDYTPLVGGSTETLEQLEKRARMRHVLTFMLPLHVELLMERYVVGGGRTLDDLAAEHCVTRQAIIKRLKVAEQDFRRLFAEHWNDDIDWKEYLTESDGEAR